MHLKLKIALLLCLTGAALFTGAEALRSLRPDPMEQIPTDIYARYARNADSASFFLRQSGPYIAVYEGRRAREPVSVTKIEMQGLRRADRAMIQAGLPVSSRLELLQLLEDLGS